MATVQAPPEDDVPFVSDQIAEQDQRAAGAAGRRRKRRADTLRPILWRLHFIGGFLAGPIVISLAITGILFAWNPQNDDLRFGDAIRRSSAQVNFSLADQVKAAQATHPDWGVHSVVPGHAVGGSGDLNTAVLMDPPGGEEGFSGPADGVNVYVDQATGRVTGDVSVTKTSDALFRGLHSNWLLGDKPRPLTELAAAWFLVSLMTGLYLWWPGLRKRRTDAFALRRRLRGRRQSKDRHNIIGVAIVVPMFFVAVTGLTWTNYTGDRYDQIRDAVFTVAPGGVDTALGQGAPASSALKNIDVSYQRAAEAKLVNPLRITLPADDKTAWKAESEKQQFPINRDAITVNGATGEVLSRYDYSSDHWLNKLRTAGVSFHQAELFGAPLRIFMTLLALGVIAVVVFGYKMWWQRRPLGGMGAPPSIRDWARNAPVGMLVIVGLLAWLLPTLGLSLLIWLVIERAWLWGLIARGKQAPKRPAGSRLARYDATLKPGIEAYKAIVIATLGLAMLLAPHIGDTDEQLDTIPMLLAWAWSRPLGVVFLVCGLIGMYAMYTTNGKPDRGDTPIAA